MGYSKGRRIGSKLTASNIRAQLLKLSIGIQYVAPMRCYIETYSSRLQLQPSDDITWTDCFGDQKCARLNLPLDHASPEGPKTQIALQMKPATNTTDYKGICG
jgi:hypothetical protein